MKLNREEIINSVDVVVKVHEVDDVQEIKKFLESIDNEVVDVRVSSYQKTDHNPRHVIVAFVKPDVK